MAKPRNIATRSATDCPTLGQSSKFPPAQLPTVADVMRYYEYIRLHQFQGRHVKGSIVANIVANDLIQFWKKSCSSISTTTPQTIASKIETKHKKYKSLINTFKIRPNNK